MKFWVFVGSFLTLTVFGIVVQLWGKKICKVRSDTLRRFFA